MQPEHSRLCRLLVLSATAASLTLAGVPVAAQYQWRDAGGRMVYSDLPPPASVDPARILGAPPARKQAVPASSPAVAASSPAGLAAAHLPGASGAGASGAGAPAAGVSPAVVTGPAQTLAERDFAYRKRLAEKAEQEKKALEASQRRLELAKACADTRSDIRSLESGQRISRINAAGEREFLSEAERADRLKDARKNAGERC